MQELTERQAEVLAFIKKYLKCAGFPPTPAEIAAKFGFKSPTASVQHIRALEDKGYVKRTPRVARGLRVL